MLLPVNDDDARGRAGGGKVVAETDGLDLRGIEPEFDEALAHRLGAAFGERAGVILREVRRGVTSNEQTGLLVRTEVGDDAADGAFMRVVEAEAIAAKDECGAGGLEAASQRGTVALTRPQGIDDRLGTAMGEERNAGAGAVTIGTIAW